MSNMDVWSNQRWSTASTMTSWHHFHLTVTKNCQNLTQLWRCNSVMVNLYAYILHWKVLKHFIYIHYGYMKQSKVVYSLDHDIVVSFPLNSHPELPKSDPASAMLWHIPTYLIERCLNTLYMYNMDVGSNQRCSTAATMTSWRHFHLRVTQNG